MDIAKNRVALNKAARLCTVRGSCAASSTTKTPGKCRSTTSRSHHPSLGPQPRMYFGKRGCHAKANVDSTDVQLRTISPALPKPLLTRYHRPFIPDGTEKSSTSRHSTTKCLWWSFADNRNPHNQSREGGGAHKAHLLEPTSGGNLRHSPSMYPPPLPSPYDRQICIRKPPKFTKPVL